MTVIAVVAATCAIARDEPPTPSPESMVEQLKPKPRTRSLRNLTVESAPAPEPTPPSLSLQIQFDFDSATVRRESEAVLRNLADALKTPELARSRFAIEGHTDAKGRVEHNRALSQRRADAVAAMLVSWGVEPMRLAASGKGSSQPAVPSDPLAAANRRVRIVNLD